MLTPTAPCKYIIIMLCFSVLESWNQQKAPRRKRLPLLYGALVSFRSLFNSHDHNFIVLFPCTAVVFSCFAALKTIDEIKMDDVSPLPPTVQN